jgi:hypothetical protein
MRTLIDKVINPLDVRKALRKAGRLIPTLAILRKTQLLTPKPIEQRGMTFC